MTRRASGKGKTPGRPENQTAASPSSLPAPIPPLPRAGSSLLELLAALSHEFLTPLAVIEGYSSTLLSQRQRLAPEEHDEFLQMIQQAGRRLGNLTEQLLEIANLEAGIIQLHHSPVDLSTLAHEAMTQAEQRVPTPLRDRFTFVLQCRDALQNPLRDPPLVKGDVLRLQQVLGHLLDNAIKYSPEGGRIDLIVQPAASPRRSGVSVHAGAGTDSVAAAFWEICVCDVGVGIADEHLERIFDPFYRVDTGLTRENYGLGLGLATCKYLITLHQGRIWAESCPDGGSAFHVWLPLEEPNVDC
ncbi:MAG: sensor histidine kinase [Ktedonobacterales bacterium]